MSQNQTKAFFLPADGGRVGQRFCLHHPARGAHRRGSIVYIHPFAEEMNKSRRMAALQAQAFSQAGFAVLQLDLYGCGDSSGDFGDASWQDWIDDIAQGSRWLIGQGGTDGEPLWLWGLRAGCLLAAPVARQLARPCNFIFWQPQSSGKQLVQQFLRLKVAGDMLGGQAKGVMEGMRQDLANGRPVEVAGYLLSPAIVAGFEHATLAPPASAGAACRLEWIDLSTREDASLSPISAKTIAQWQETGFATRSQIVQGPAFWQTTEIEDVPALVAASNAALAK